MTHDDPELNFFIDAIKKNPRVLCQTGSHPMTPQRYVVLIWWRELSDAHHRDMTNRPPTNRLARVLRDVVSDSEAH